MPNCGDDVGEETSLYSGGGASAGPGRGGVWKGETREETKGRRCGRDGTQRSVVGNAESDDVRETWLHTLAVPWLAR